MSASTIAKSMLCAGGLGLLPHLGHADLITTISPTSRNALCIGFSCESSASFDRTDLLRKAANNLLKLGTNANSSAVLVTGQLLFKNTALNVPDYVFSDGYVLASLAEVETFIAAHGHLPGAPSAAQVAKAGALDMSAMQMVQLKMIEELTLHSSEQNKQIAAKAVENAALAVRLGRVEASVLD